MNDDHRELWQAVDAGRESFLDEFRESRKERKEQMDTIAQAIHSRLADFDGKFDTLAEKVTEAHGAAKFGNRQHQHRPGGDNRQHGC